MKRWRTKFFLAAAVPALLIALPVAGQQSAPESLLPPGFGDPDTLPPPVEETQRPPPPRPAPTAPAAPPTTALPAPTPDERSAAGDIAALGQPQSQRIFDIPEDARRGTDLVGVLGPANWGLAANAWGNGNGAFLTSLMRRIDAPLASRWASILLRRALLSRVPPPPLVDPVDWVAERAWLLLRMGEADGARMLVQSVDVDLYTPRMIAVAVQTALATADPPALCPLVAPGRATSDEPVWPLADAMCAAMEGEASRASALVDQARRRSGARGIDLVLAEKIVGAGTDTRRAVNVDWEGVDSINAWRFGLASAAGTPIPAPLMAGAGAQVHAWLARAPMIPAEQRIDAADIAASLGVFGHDSLVELHSLILDRTDPAEIGGTIGARLRSAYTGSPADRLAALRDLWGDAETAHQRHARRILTAGAAARIAPHADHRGDSGELIAALFAAGMDDRAARWADVVNGGGEDSDRAWALLAVGAPRAAIDPGRLSAFQSRDNSPNRHRTAMLAAALAGLDRLSPDAARNLAGDSADFTRENRWTGFLANAVRARQSGTVALIAAAGLQTADWRGVPPDHLFHIVRALRQVGLDYEARMIAAEALSRL